MSGAGQTAAAQASVVVVQVGDTTKPLEELTDAELQAYVASLEGDDPLKVLTETKQNENLTGSGGEGDTEH